MGKTKSFDVVVVGAGIMGTFHAYHCLQRGLKVALIEKNQKPQGATVRNFGQIVPSGMNIKWQRLGRRSTEIYKAIQSDIDISVRQYGSVYLASTEDECALLEELAVINQQENYPSYLLSEKECLDKWSGLKESYCKKGLYFPDEIVVDPRLLIHSLIEYCCKKFGMAYFPNRTILSIEQRSSGCRCTDNQSSVYEAEKVFVCSGAEARLLFPGIFANAGIQAVKLHMLKTVPQPSQRLRGSILTGRTIRRYESFQDCPSFAAIKAKEDQSSFAYAYGVHILFKQAEDNSVIIGDSHEYANLAEQDSLGFDLKESINAFMLAEARDIFDLEDWTIDLAWSGVYAQMSEGDIFQATIEQDIHIITGIGGKGMTASAGFAEKHISELYS